MTQISRKALLFSTVVGSALLAGCTLTENKTVGQSTLKAEKPIEQTEVESKTEQQKPQQLHGSSLDSNTMFTILAAEMMAKKGQAAAAFEVLYPLAVQTQDKELARRVFQISMSTYDLDSIEQATLLWRKVAPESSIVWRASFLLSLRNGNVDEALKQWTTYRDLSELNIASVMVSSATKVASTVPKEYGISFFQSLTEQFKTEWSAYYALGMVSTVYKNPAIGIPALEKAKALMLEEDGKDNQALIYNLLSKLYLMSYPPEKGIEALAPYLETNPTDLLVQERMARLEVQAQRYAQAESRYNLIIKAEPEAYTSMFSLALLQLERQSYEEAEKNLLKVSQKKGYHSVGQYYLGILYQEKGDFSGAKKRFELVKSDGYRVDAQLHLAEIYFAEKNEAKAFTILDALQPSAPNEKVKVIRAKAIFKSAQNEYSQAIELYNQALSIEPSSLAMLKAQSLLFYKSEDFVNYEANLLKVLKLEEQDSDALNALGYFYVEQNIKLEQAKVLLEKALALEPESYYILDSMGWYYYQVGNYSKALELLNRAFDKAKDDEVLIHLVSAYWQVGDINRAKSLWQEYHAKFKSNDRVQNLINELESESVK